MSVDTAVFPGSVLFHCDIDCSKGKFRHRKKDKVEPRTHTSYCSIFIQLNTEIFCCENKEGSSELMTVGDRYIFYAVHAQRSRDTPNNFIITMYARQVSCFHSRDAVISTDLHYKDPEVESQPEVRLSVRFLDCRQF